MRRLAIALLPGVAALLLIVATLAGYGWRVFYDSREFSARATAALQEPAVRSAIAERATDELVRRHPNLLAVRPALLAAVSGAVGSDAFAALFRGAAGDLHAAVFRRRQDTVTLTVADVGAVAVGALQVLRPQLASELEGRDPVALARRDVGPVADAARLAGVLALICGALAVAAAAALLLLSAERRQEAFRLGVAVALAGLAVVASEWGARVLFTDGAVERAVWSAFFSDLRLLGLVIASAGAVLAAAARSFIRPLEVEVPMRRAWELVVAEPERDLWRVLRGVALIAAGAIAIFEPAAVVRAALTLAGLYTVYKGLEAILTIVNGDAVVERPRLRRAVVPVLAGGLVAGAVAVFVAGGGVDAPARVVSGCRALCDRPLDQVTLPATHNAMSVPLPGWFAALQEHPIPRQLEDGIRGLLLDTHYADKLPNGRVRTYFSSKEDLRRTITQDGVSEHSVAAALRLRERLGFRGEGERGMYLCHTFCELGATPLSEVLEQLNDFLVTHPSAVIEVVNQDYVTPADFVGALKTAGLDRYALVPPAPGGAWPTLQELIDSDKRLLVLAENRAGAAPWYQLAYARLVQETPFTFSRAPQLTDPAGRDASCRSNRGTADAPLFLVNHWINTDPLPQPGLAAEVNAYGPMLARARACERLRGRRVNLLAVDFYEEGDLFKVVDALNFTR